MPGESPHGGYATTTNKCKTCHAVHLATGSYNLLRTDDPSTQCNVCHGLSGLANTKPIVLDQNGHGLPPGTTGVIYAPDDLADTSTPSAARFRVNASEWGCESCHSVHGANTIQLVDVGGGTNTKLLKKFPNPNKTADENYTDYKPVSSPTTQRLSNWCSACHNANIGLHTVAKEYNSGTHYYGHDTSATAAAGVYGDPNSWNGLINPNDGINNGPSCKQCHLGNGDTSTAYGFPHSSSTAPSMLDATSSASGLDGVCLSCHKLSNLP